MNTSDRPGWEGPLADFPQFHLATHRNWNKGICRGAVTDAALKTVFEATDMKSADMRDAARRIVTAQQFVLAVLRRLEAATQDRVMCDAPTKTDLANLAHAEKLFGDGHHEGVPLALWLAALPQRPYADEIMLGLINAVRECTLAYNMHHFGLPDSRGWKA